MIRPERRLPGNSYANMQALLGVTLNSSGTATYSVDRGSHRACQPQYGRERLRAG